jgi:uncharacterized protein
MVSDKPFVHLFNTHGGNYIYDVNTNMFLKVPKHVYDYLNAQLHNRVDKPDETNEVAAADIIKRMKEDGFLSIKRPSEIVHPYDGTLEYQLKKKLRLVTLQVTQQCNLRCAYCAYSGSYMNREHSNKKMSIETAKKGIDFLINNSKDSDRIGIGFYGGEPLLEFKLIKQCIEYAKERAEGKDLSLTATVNGTLLSENIVEYFEEHGLNLLISLDGPRQIHDKNRKFSNNSCGSFDMVIDKLEMIKEKFPNYFKSNITFNSVLDMENDFSCVNEFFTNYETVKDSMFTSQIVSDRYSKNKVVAREEFISGMYYEYFKLYLSKLGRLDKKHVSRIVENEYSATKEAFMKGRRHEKCLPDKCHPSGPCVPGATRLFIDIYGNLFPCERVSETSEIMKIGHIDTGFDIDKVRKLLNIGKLTENNCKQCWTFRYCALCATSVDNLNEFSPGNRLSLCARMRDTIEYDFKDYCTLKELGYILNDGSKLVSYA